MIAQFIKYVPKLNLVIYIYTRFRMNRDVDIVVHNFQLDDHNSLDIMQYNVTMDAMDNLVPSYYLMILV